MFWFHQAFSECVGHFDDNELLRHRHYSYW